MNLTNEPIFSDFIDSFNENEILKFNLQTEIKAFIRNQLSQSSNLGPSNRLTENYYFAKNSHIILKNNKIWYVSYNSEDRGENNNSFSITSNLSEDWSYRYLIGQEIEGINEKLKDINRLESFLSKPDCNNSFRKIYLKSLIEENKCLDFALLKIDKKTRVISTGNEHLNNGLTLNTKNITKSLTNYMFN